MTNEDVAADHAFDQACRFMIEVGKAAHRYGSTAVRIESFLWRLAAALGYRGTFRSTPTEILFAFREKEGSWQRTELEAVPGGGQELNRLAAVGELVDAVEKGEATLAEATARLQEIDTIPHPWSNLAVGASFVVAGAGFAIVLSGGIWDVILSAVLSLVVFLTVGVVARVGGARAGEWLPFTTALVVGVLTAGAKIAVPELNPIVVAVCALIILVPGFAVSVGMLELVSNHVVSGMANLMNGLLYLAKQFAGAWLGYALVTLVASIPHAAAAPPVGSEWLLVAFLPLLAALGFAFQTAPRDFPATMFICGVTFGCLMLVSATAGANLGNLIATVIAVVLSNLWSTRTGRPTTITLLPAIMLLVSGSIGFRGLAAMAEGQVALGRQQFIQMFVVAITIGAGLLVGNTIVRPKVTL